MLQHDPINPNHKLALAFCPLQLHVWWHWPFLGCVRQLSFEQNVFLPCHFVSASSCKRLVFNFRTHPPLPIEPFVQECTLACGGQKYPHRYNRYHFVYPICLSAVSRSALWRELKYHIWPGFGEMHSGEEHRQNSWRTPFFHIHHLHVLSWTPALL